ncbi:MAG: HdaA/DnaA family protein [Alphaproteobacteria bacterium]
MADRQLPLAFPVRPALAMDDFMVADSNRAAVAWIDRWPAWPHPVLALHGPPGCGKSHLAHVFRAVSGAVMIDPDALGAAETPELLGQARAAVLDDAERAARTSERPLLHLYNLVVETRRSLLLVGRLPPARWTIGLADLRSRLAAVPAVEIREPDDGLIVAVLQKLFSDRQLDVAPEVIGFLARRMQRSFEAARRLVEAIDAAALSQRSNITVPLVQRVLLEQGQGD